ncbi:7518_t:CDS:2, partial [Dentiscutata erythropus]
MVFRWRGQEEKFKVARSSKRRVGSGQKPAYPLAEDALKCWIDELRNEGIAHYPNVSETFKASYNWFYGFMNHYDLSLRPRQNNNLDLACIGNMDETPIFFDMVGQLTVNYRCAKTVQIKTTGNDKNRFTCVFSVLANGMKLLSMVILKVKRLPRGPFTPDSFKGHLTDVVKEKFKETNTIMGVIPGGLMSLVQVLDVSINKPFKDHLCERWRNWMANGEFQPTKGENFKKPTCNLMYQWIVEAWEDIPTKIIEKSFKKCGISNELDGSEDYLIHSEEKNDELEEPFI